MVWLQGSSEMADRIRAHDWASTPLGPIGCWPAELRVSASLMLGSAFPMALVWAPGLTTLYNDAFISIIGSRTDSLGRSFAENCGGSWEMIGPLVRRAYAGETSLLEDFPLMAQRATGAEQAWFTFSYSPVRSAEGEVAGMIVTATDTSNAVLAKTALAQTSAGPGDEEVNAAPGAPDWRAALEQQVRDRTAELKKSHDFLKATMDASTDIIQVFEAVRDEQGRIVDFRWLLNNPTAESYYGDVRGQRLLESNPGVVQEGIFDCFREVTETGIPRQDERHYVHKQFDGWFIQSVVRLGDGVATTTKDITAWKKAQEELLALRDAMVQTRLHESEERLRQLIEGIPQLVWRASGNGQWTWASPQWTRYTRLTDEESRQEGWLKAVYEADRHRVRQAWAEAEKTGEFRSDYRLFHAAEGRHRWFQTRATPVRDASGRIIEWLGTSTDVDDLRGLETRQRLLVAELQHRVRNILTVVRSVFGRTAEASEDLDHVVDHFRGRLDSLARTQVVVTQSATGMVDLESLVRDELLSVGAGDGPYLRITGPDVKLQSKAAEMLGLAVHELTTNALKYGALSTAKGKIDILWSVNSGYGGEDRLDFIWEEQGVPAISLPPSRRGFGRELIEDALPYSLAAKTELQFRGGGIRCVISLPLRDPERAASDQE